jgi:hypothetical protein
MMKSAIFLFGATALAFAPSLASAQQTSSSVQTKSGQALGQPNQSCQTINGGNTGTSYPGNTSTAPGSAFNETNGLAGTKYAGSQTQNSVNTASVAQYDVACEMQPQ